MKLDPKLQAQLGEMFKPVASVVEAPPEGTPQFLMVTLDSLHTGPQPRTQFDQDELRDLQNSIEQLARSGQGIGGSGILQPLLARALPDGTLRLVAGERRLRAAKAAGVTLVPVVVGTAHDEKEAFGQAIVENLLRADLSPLEEARALQRWMTDTKFSLRVAAQKLGRDKGYLENRLRLLSMGEDVQNMVSSRRDTLPHARLIDAVSDQEERQRLIQMVVEKGAGKREIEITIAKRHKNKPSFRKDSEDIAADQDEDTNASERVHNKQNRRATVLSSPVYEAWKSLQKVSNRVEGEEALQLAEQLEKLAKRLRKAVPTL